MGQVIDNLVINAVQAMPEGGVIRIQAENVQMGCDRLFPRAKGRYVKIAVSDQGIGIPQEHLSRIFDPFFTTKSKGTGLGLTTSYSIVSKHDGLLTVDSPPGEGTTFHLYLPASGRAAEARKEPAPVAHRGRGRILVMDDDAIVRQVLGQMLGEMGYQAEFAGDGAEAVELYRRSRENGAPFDAVIMDLTIPGGLGGKEAIGRLQALDPGVKAIVSSGYCDDPVMTEFRRYGFRAFLAKPYKNDELSRVLRSVLAGETA
jgi:two-component system cell cycle sensor histidine kinase/response regulator CckA